MQRIVHSQKRSDVPIELLQGPDFKLIWMCTISDWAVIILCWYLMLYTSPYLYPIWGIIVAGRLHAFGVLLHELTHMHYKRKTLNIRFLELFLGYPIGTTVEAMAYHHIRHHRNTLLNSDPYFNINKKCSGLVRFWLTLKKGIFFTPFWIARSIVGVFALFLPFIRTSYARIFLQDNSRVDLSKDEEVIRCAKEDVPLALFHASLLLLALKFNLIFFLYYAVLPAAGMLCIYRLLIEHEYDIVSDRSVYSLIESTFDHHLSIWGRFFFAPRNIGYHCMHHIHPMAGMQQLPKLANWYAGNCPPYQERTRMKKKWTLKQDLFGGLN